ncbi:MAG: type I phosphomannose isomerase catalytic subunit [Anaerolineae bacterium]
MNDKIYPLTFTPVLRDYIWGGRRLETLFSRQLPPGITAESWEISGYEGYSTYVDSGYWEGVALPDVMTDLGVDLLGHNSVEMLARHRFPLLIKLLDAHRDLSVQVHPDDAYASEHEGGELGKTEMWTVLYADPGAEVIYGLTPGTTRETLREAIERGTLEQHLYRLPIQAGDSLLVSAGTVHALLAGAVVAEIQQNSDMTYRLYDWGRVGADDKPRPLHINKALDVIDYAKVRPGKIEPQVLREDASLRHLLLADTGRFVTEQVHMQAGGEFVGHCTGETFEIWGCLNGSAEVRWLGEPVRLDAVRFVLLPAVLGEYAVHANQPCTLLRTYVGREQ